MRARKILVWVLTLALALQCFAGIPALAADVTDADPQLLAAVRKARGLADDAVVTDADFASVSSLIISGVRSLSGIEKATRLRTLKVTDSPAMGDDSLAYLENLQLNNVTINGTAITKVPSFRKNASVSDLDLDHNNISDVTALATMTSLRSILLDDNALTDDGLAYILEHCGDRLIDLYISDNDITDLSAFAQYLPLGLVRLSVEGCGLTDFTPLRSLNALTTLKISRNAPTAASLDVIKSLPLSTLYVADCGITDFSFLSSLSTLRYFDASGNADGLDSLLTALENCSLDALYADRLGLSDVTRIPLTSLSTLSLKSNDIRSIEGIPSAGRMVLADNHIADLTPLSGMSFSTLDVSNNCLVSLSGVPARTTSLVAYNNNITDVKALEGSSVEHLYLQNNLLTSISTLAGLENLRTVNLSRNYLDLSDPDVAADYAAIVAANKSAADQLSMPTVAEPESPTAAVSKIDSADIQSDILVSTKSLTRGSLVTVRATCRNVGTTDLGAYTFTVAVSPDVGITVLDGETTVDGDTLAAGEANELIITLRIDDDYSGGDTVKVFTRVITEGNSYATNAATLSVCYISLSSPAAAIPGIALPVYGEATVGSSVSIHAVYSDGSDTEVATTSTASGSRWFSVKIPADKVTADLSQLYAVVTKSGASHTSNTVDVDVNTEDVVLVDSKIATANGRVYDANPRTGFPTLSVSLPTSLIGPDLIPRVKFGNPQAVASVKFSFLNTTVNGVYDAALGCYTAPAFSRWTATGVQRMTAEVTQTNGVTHTFTVAQFTILIDPSGIVRDEDGHPLEGVEVTIEQKSGSEWVKWDAEAHMQKNPLLTDLNGYYGWDVPEGTYRLKLTKEGYAPQVVETYTTADGATDTITVLPVRTDVDVVMQITALGRLKAAMQSVLDGVTATNDTDLADIVAALEQAADGEDVTLTWSTELTKTDATTSAAGSIVGTLVVTDNVTGDEITLDVALVIAKLPYVAPPYTPPSGGSTSDVKSDKSEDKSDTPDEVEQPTPPEFDDVAPDHWAAEDIAYMAARGYFIGTDDRTFDPSGGMTRGMMAALLGRIAGVQPTDAGDEFADVDPNMYYAPYVSWAYGKGIVTGMDDGSFQPERFITRQEICVMVARYLGDDIPSGSLDDFSDADTVAPWARDAVASLHAMGIINGMTDGTFSPKLSATRAQCAAILHRMLTLTAE